MKKYKIVRPALYAFAMGQFACHGAMAQGAEVLELDPIVVTGENSERSLKETAASVEVFSAAEILESAGKHDLTTLLSGVANVVYPGDVGTPYVRGQTTEGPHTGANAFFGGTVPRATVNVDGRYLSWGEFYFGATSTWDVEQVEVFKGPQTTSQGANAIAGSFIVNTKDPTFDREGAYRVEYGSYNQKRASVALNTPLGEDFAARLALDYSGRDTFIDFDSPNFVQNSIGQDFENIDGRFKLLWQPKDISGFEAMLTYNHAQVTRPTVEASRQPYDQLKSSARFVPGWRQKLNTGILDLKYETENGIGVSNKTVLNRSRIDRRVGIATIGDAIIEKTGLSNETIARIGDADGVLSGVLGTHIAQTEQDERLNQAGISTFSDSRSNLGIFGEVTWRPADRWTVIGGLRYQRDALKRTGSVSPLFANSGPNLDAVYEEILPKLSVAYDVTEDATIGVLASKGYNPGGIALDYASSKSWQEYKPETVWNYELFARARMLDDKLSVNANVFYQDWKNSQRNIFQVTGGVPNVLTLNAEEAHAYGAEIGIDFSPISELQLGANLGLLQTEITKFSTATAYEGNKFNQAPEVTFSFNAAWDVTEKFRLSGQARYTGQYFSDTQNTKAYEVDDFAIVDLQAAYQATDAIEIYAYANNVFDKRVPMRLEQERSTRSYTQAYLTTPRMIGIGLRGEF